MTVASGCPAGEAPGIIVNYHQRQTTPANFYGNELFSPSMALMGSRKRVKPNPPGGRSRTSLNQEPAADEGSTPTAASQGRQSGRGTSWYLNSWPRGSKAAAVTEVARESISAPGNVAAEPTNPHTSASNTPKPLSTPSIRLTQKEGASTRSLPADAATTRVNIASKPSASTPDIPNSLTVVSDSNLKKEIRGASESFPGESGDSKGDSEDPSGTGVEQEQGPENQPTNQPTGWLGWLSRSSGTAQSAPKPVDVEKPSTGTSSEGKESQDGQPPAEPSGSGALTPPSENKATEPPAAQKRSWLQMWGGSSSTRHLDDESRKETKQEIDPTSTSIKDGTAEATAETTVEQPDANSGTPINSSETKPDTSRASIWGFLYRDKPKESVDWDLKESNEETKASAVAKSTVDDNSKSQPTSAKKDKPTLPSAPETDVTPVGSDISSSVPSNGKTKGPEAAASKQLQKVLPNQLLPSFKDTFPPQQRPSLLQQLGRLIHYTKEPENKHVYVVPNPPHIKKAVAIGIHGYFPAPFIRTVIGQPTGTSVKFSDMAAKAIRKWTADHGYDCEVEKIALEGEGRIAERGELLWNLLLNWIEDLRKADFIQISCHSQGVPVAVMLLAKLISFGCVNSARIGICAMAGVNMGPFVDYRSRWISGSAGELFDFSNPNSQVSRDYSEALQTALDFGVRIVYVGSIDDQLVSLESSTFSCVSHPYIYRAVFVDGRAHAPSFLSHLVGFALKLRNLGISDHGIIKELSSPLAGSLYSGEGHSRLYDDEAVYYLAVECALETSSVSGASLQTNRPYPVPSPNPYILPFSMRGLLEEEYVRDVLYDETMELLKQFEDWKPSSKVLKDVKFRLEGIRSKL